MSDEFDHLRFDIRFAISHDTYVPISRQMRSEWTDHAARKIAERLREHWEFKRKPGIQSGPGFPMPGS